MSKGDLYPAEACWHTDRATGARVRQLTSHPSVSHPSYFLQCSFLPGSHALFLTSYRSGNAQLYLADYPEGTLTQITGDEPIHPFSPAFNSAFGEIVFTRKGALWAVRVDTFEERLIYDFGGAQLGEPSISADGEWLTAAYRCGAERGLVAGRQGGGDWRRIPFPRTVIHPQFHPLEPEWIEFAADPAPRMHRVRRDGSGLECLYEHSNDEFVVHETFLGKTGDLVFTVWPRLLCRMDWNTRAVRQIAAFNAWHIAPNRAGTAVLCDTNHPDDGLQIVDVATGARRQVCLSESSNRGSQWKTSRYALPEDFAAASRATGPQSALSWMEADNDTVYGPQCTHPHPSWSDDEARVTFASDRTGSPQVYVAELSVPI